MAGSHHILLPVILRRAQRARGIHRAVSPPIHGFPAFAGNDTWSGAATVIA